MKQIGLLCVLAACKLQTSSSSAGGMFPSQASGPTSSDGGPPGGPVTDVAKDCSAAHDHCVRGTWFSSAGTIGKERAYVYDHNTPVYQYQGKWYAWDGTLQEGGTAYSSKPATIASLETAHNVIAWEPPDPAGEIVVPRNEKEALVDGQWTFLASYEVDATTNTVVGHHSYPISSARVLGDPITIE